MPVIGYIDWRFADHGLIVDLKTTERFPSQIGDAHGRQGAVYASAHGNFGMRFAYVKPAPGKTDRRQVTVYEMSGDEIRRHLAALRAIALSLGRFLAVSNDARELAGLIVPDFDSLLVVQSRRARGGPRKSSVSESDSQRERRNAMGLNIGGSGIIKPYVKYNAKADKWFVRSPEGGDQEIARPTFLLDLEEHPHRLAALPRRPGAGARDRPIARSRGAEPGRGLQARLRRYRLQPEVLRRRRRVLVSLDPSLERHPRRSTPQFEEDGAKTENRGKVPVVACTGSEPMKDKYGTNYRPKLDDREVGRSPAELPDESPVDDVDVWKGTAPAAAKARAACRAARRPSRAAEPLSEPLF